MRDNDVKNTGEVREQHVRKPKLESINLKIPKKQKTEIISLQEVNIWENIFDVVSDWVILTDIGGRILKTNKIGEKFNEFQGLKPFHWKIEFAQILNEGGFDIIVGNPPYVFIRGKNFSVLEEKFYKTKYLANYESLAKGKARQSRKINTFSLFTMRCFDLLKPRGFLGFIIPNTIFTGLIK